MTTEPVGRTTADTGPGGLPPRLLERRGGALLVVLSLTVGAMALPGLGWLIGVVLLWSSSGWTRRDEVVGTATGPLALALPFAARVLLPFDVSASSSSGCGEGGFCAPHISVAWWADVSNIGAFLVVIHGMLAVFLIVRFRVGGITTAHTERDRFRPSADAGAAGS